MSCVIHGAENNQDKDAALEHPLEPPYAVVEDAGADIAGSKPGVPQNAEPILTTLLRTVVGLPLSGSKE